MMAGWNLSHGIQGYREKSSVLACTWKSKISPEIREIPQPQSCVLVKIGILLSMIWSRKKNNQTEVGQASDIRHQIDTNTTWPVRHSTQNQTSSFVSASCWKKRIRWCTCFCPREDPIRGNIGYDIIIKREKHGIFLFFYSFCGA